MLECIVGTTNEEGDRSLLAVAPALKFICAGAMANRSN
jgi:hypothetical protein